MTTNILGIPNGNSEPLFGTSTPPGGFSYTTDVFDGMRTSPTTKD